MRNFRTNKVCVSSSPTSSSNGDGRGSAVDTATGIDRVVVVIDFARVVTKAEAGMAEKKVYEPKKPVSVEKGGRHGVVFIRVPAMGEQKAIEADDRLIGDTGTSVG